jgi:hypothetical protein
MTKFNLPRIALLPLCFALFASPAFAIDADLTSYGALCNGTADDTQELRNAFADAGSRWDNLIFPSGKVCKISGRVSISGKSGFKVTGNNATIRAANGMPPSDTLLFFYSSSNFQVYDLTIDGNRQNRTERQTAAHNITVADVHNFLFQNVRSNNSTTDGFEVRGRTQKETSSAHFTTDGQFVNCQAHNSNRLGMHIEGAARVTVRGGSYSDSNGGWPQAGIDVEPNEGSIVPSVYDVLITGIRAEGNNGFGIQLSAKYGTRNITVENSYFSDNARGGVSVTPLYTTIRNNLFELFIRNTGEICPGTYCFRSVIEVPSGSLGNSLIEGNTIIDARPNTSGIFVHKNAASGTTIRSNCLENVLPLTIKNGGGKATLTENQVNPSGGCPLPSEVPLP